jgi:hypothetical protein
MIDIHTVPPRWAYALLRAVLRPADVESVPGDLLEEYRATRRPSLGRFGADVWYVRQVGSIVWRVVWPFVAAAVALRVLAFPLPGPWNPSLVQTPGVSVVDACVFVWVGFVAGRRTGRLVSGIVCAGLTGFASIAMLFVYAAVRYPALLRAPFEKPFIVAIVITLFAIAVGFAMVFGTVGAAAGRVFAALPGRTRVG